LSYGPAYSQDTTMEELSARRWPHWEAVRLAR